MENLTYTSRILKKPTVNFTSWCSTLFTLLSVLEAGSISDMPLITQISVFCQLHRTVHHLNSACQDWACLSERADGTRGRCVWSSQTAYKEAGKAKEKKEGGEGTPRHDNRPHQCRARSGCTVGQRKQTDCTCSAASQCHGCTKLLSINADLFVCTAATVGWWVPFSSGATVMGSHETSQTRPGW